MRFCCGCRRLMISVLKTKNAEGSLRETVNQEQISASRQFIDWLRIIQL
jgi:hypothetical protein